MSYYRLLIQSNVNVILEYQGFIKGLEAIAVL